MSELYVEIGRIKENQTRDSLVLPRSAEVFDAVSNHADATLIVLREIFADDQLVSEIVVFDLLCDDVAPRNAFNIGFVEPVAIVLHKDQSQLLDTYALRKDFPQSTGHQNHVSPDWPASLCLYSESALAIYRSWTAERHIRTLQVWLEKASQGALHEQNLYPEQFYYVSPLELVLPWDFSEKVGNPKYRLAIKQATQTSNRTWLGSMQELSEAIVGPHVNLIPFAVEVDAIVGNSVEREPSNLAEIEERLQARGTSIVARFGRQLIEMVGDGV